MNPSATGWIPRFLEDYRNDIQNLSEFTLEEFYAQLKLSGFIYGTNIIPVSQKHNKDFKLTQEELAKVNLFNALFVVYKRKLNQDNSELCLNAIIDFYLTLKKSNKSFLNFSLNWKSNNPAQEVEKILHHRVQTNDSFIQKNFSNIVTNALLFIDVLAFIKFLDGENASAFATKLEEVIVDAVYFALKEKKIKGKYDSVILKLIQSSLRYHQINEEHLDALSEVDLSLLKSNLEKKYLIDVVCMTLYTDEEIDEKEKNYVISLAEKLSLSKTEIEHSIQFLYDFVEKNKSDIYYFNISNPAKYFYDKTHRSVSLLIHRNRKRILQELYESKELLQLIILSTNRELDDVEKKKVKTQLLDIFKTIPSLTIFALPGGTLLLPIIIKMIPTILPSSFNENMKESEKKIKK